MGGPETRAGRNGGGIFRAAHPADAQRSVLNASGGIPPAAAAKQVRGQHHRYLSEVITSLLSRALP